MTYTAITEKRFRQEAGSPARKLAGEFGTIEDEFASFKTGRGATYVVAADNAPVHVKSHADYVCDGVADQVEIQAAIDATPNRNQVKLSGGHFTIDEPIHLTSSNIKLFGIGADATEIGLASDSNCDMIVGDEATQKFFCTIEKLTLNGNNANNTIGNGINLNDSYPDFRLNDTFIHRCAYSGLKATLIWGYKLTNNVIEWCGNAGDDYYGVYLHSGGESIISGCHVSSNYSNANMALFNISRAVVVGGEYSRGCKLGMWISGGSRNKVIGASFLDNQSVGMGGYLADILMSGDKHIIANNTFTGTNNDYRINISSGEYNNIHDNQFDAVNTIAVFDEADYTKIHHNIGFVTENSGTATLLSAATSIDVPHGLAVTPVAGDIVVTPIEAWGNMTTYYIGNYGATNFTIYSPIAPGQDVDFAWKAIVL